MISLSEVLLKDAGNEMSKMGAPLAKFISETLAPFDMYQTKTLPSREEENNCNARRGLTAKPVTI